MQQKGLVTSIAISYSLVSAAYGEIGEIITKLQVTLPDHKAVNLLSTVTPNYTGMFFDAPPPDVAIKDLADRQEVLVEHARSLGATTGGCGRGYGLCNLPRLTLAAVSNLVALLQTLGSIGGSYTCCLLYPR